MRLSLGLFTQQLLPLLLQACLCNNRTHRKQCDKRAMLHSLDKLQVLELQPCRESFFWQFLSLTAFF